jgi:hypothetical protein
MIGDGWRLMDRGSTGSILQGTGSAGMDVLSIRTGMHWKERGVLGAIFTG